MKSMAAAWTNFHRRSGRCKGPGLRYEVHSYVGIFPCRLSTSMFKSGNFNVMQAELAHLPPREPRSMLNSAPLAHFVHP